LKEPLRNVSIYGEILGKRYADKLDSHGKQYLNFVRLGANRLERLVGDLLAYTQVSKFDLPQEASDGDEALHDALGNLQEAIHESEAKIGSDPLPSLRVHRTHLTLLLQNLIGNALKYRSPDRTPVVHIGAEHRDGLWSISVTDNGIGIEPQYKERIFGLFKRLHTGDEYSGTGIGLAICQRIVERYRGRIWVESEPGQGSIFRFTLPG
jgi:light-regulated signal transduction histidine kinase (bacteriophytochrome)